MNVDSGAVLGEARYLAFAIDRDAQFVDPAGQDSLDVVLPQCKSVRMSSGKIADIQPDLRESGDLRYLAARQKAIGDPPLIQYFDGAAMQSAGASADGRLTGAPLDDCDVDACQRQFASQHQPRRAAAGNGHGICAAHFAVPQMIEF